MIVLPIGRRLDTSSDGPRVGPFTKRQSFKSEGEKAMDIDYKEAARLLGEMLDAQNVTIEVKFVPWSQSRNREEKHPSLNWKVKVKRNGKEILECDYMQGVGHMTKTGKPQIQADLRRAEHAAAENGKVPFFSANHPGGFCFLAKPQPGPSVVDVLSSLLMDGDVLDYAGFEDWASNFGYDEDSRKAEKIYRDCIETALKLKAALSDLDKLRELAGQM
jgi:hypothetical protein